jgi:hypothetical protein
MTTTHPAPATANERAADRMRARLAQIDTPTLIAVAEDAWAQRTASEFMRLVYAMTCGHLAARLGLNARMLAELGGPVTLEAFRQAAPA